MLTAEGCRMRRERLWAALEDQPDWILIADPKHVTYFTGHFATPFIFSSATGGAMLILGADGSSVLVTDNVMLEFANRAHVDEIVAPTWYRCVESAVQRETMLVESTLEVMRKRPGLHIGFEASKVPAGLVDGLRPERGFLRLTAVDPIIHRLKRSKDPDEMDLIRRSMQAGDAGHTAALRDVRPGLTELEAFLIVQEAAMRAAGDRVLVYGDLVSGPRCDEIGGPPSDRVIREGDLVLLDISVVVDGYRGDFANTFVCGAKPSAEQQRLYEACLEALAEGERLIRSGRPCREIDQAVRSSFEAKQLAAYFDSHSGHGLGLGHPDPPYLVPESTETLVAGDVIALEPGLYIKGTAGMRYEHNYHVTEKGRERLSNHALQIEQPG